VLLVGLSSPGARLRGRAGELLPKRRACVRCGTLISAYATASDRYCLLCAPRVDDEPPHDPALYCARGHLRSDFEVVRIDRARASGVKTECLACKRDRERDRHRDRSRAALEARALKAPALKRPPVEASPRRRRRQAA
jgi:hypothetical protein